MQPTATAGGGVMYSRIIRKEDPAAKAVISPSNDRTVRPFLQSRRSISQSTGVPPAQKSL